MKTLEPRPWKSNCSTLCNPADGHVTPLLDHYCYQYVVWIGTVCILRMCFLNGTRRMVSCMEHAAPCRGLRLIADAASIRAIGHHLSMPRFHGFMEKYHTEMAQRWQRLVNAANIMLMLRFQGRVRAFFIAAHFLGSFALLGTILHS